jgi:hypothetical protein
MISIQSVFKTTSLSAIVLAFVACESTQTTGTIAESPLSKVDGAVFTENFADEGLFTIEKNPDGGYNYSVGARIGSEAENRMTGSIDVATLEEIYLQIHGGKATIPAIVTEASKWLKSRPTSGIEKGSPISEPLAKTATESAFKTGYCRNFTEGAYYVWKPTSCIWHPNRNLMGTSGVNSYHDANDRVWVWNATAYTGQLSLWNTNNTAKASTWMPTIKPYWVTWFSWGGTYQNANARLQLPGTFGGELGLSNSTRYLK